jgi:putative endonuclease
VSAFVYLVRCRDGSLYCGWTDDLVRRLARHNAGTGAAYTRSRRPVVLVYHEPYADKRQAMAREYAIKRLSRADKLRLLAPARLRAR